MADFDGSVSEIDVSSSARMPAIVRKDHEATLAWDRGHGASPRYVRLRPRSSLSAILEGRGEQGLPEKAHDLIAKTTVETLTLPPTPSYGLSPAREGSGSLERGPAGT
jgi:hypothetical protein